MLHRSKPQISHTWLPVDAATWGRTLLGAIKADPDHVEGRARTLVFARDVAAAGQVASVLERDGLSPVVYHKGVTQEERSKALEHMATAANAIMVSAGGPQLRLPANRAGLGPRAGACRARGRGCGLPRRARAAVPTQVSTDAAARGIDIAQVTQVVQADFASNAVDFLHRIGRTARAGCSGKVASLYMPEDAPLAEVQQQFIEAGEPIEGAFSRNRSFSKKMKEYGKFVPRGQGSD
jgi:superfamily II DNA/RNA helicase